ncbi:MAG: hypothetical protein HYT63_01635 [Candidatus Yanofskybacteria bacterium]|nr:hypothetical protein [Candidatus Yanofskybacteria bacterium]
MRRFSLVLCLSVILLTACGKSVHLPAPGPEKEKQTQEQKEVAKQKNSFLKKLNSLEKDYHELNSKLLEKRSRGYKILKSLS